MQRQITLFFSNGEILKHSTKGTTPQLQRAFFVGREINNKTITATTIEDPRNENK